MLNFSGEPDWPVEGVFEQPATVLDHARAELLHTIPGANHALLASLVECQVVSPLYPTDPFEAKFVCLDVCGIFHIQPQHGAARLCGDRSEGWGMPADTYEGEMYQAIVETLRLSPDRVVGASLN